MLAMKRVMAARDPVSTYVFDEVDAGVGGATAETIGDKLKRVSQERQVICITHLAQIASLANQHLVVEKDRVGDEMQSHVRSVESDDRVHEIARMLGGAKSTDAVQRYAQEMIAAGRMVAA
jgi:DNA repair protein RecN (Recombination protein N)